MPSVVFITMVATIATVATLANGVITANGTLISDTYFYGQSPPVYPSPKLDGTGSWADSYVKATTFVQNLTLQEKISLTAGASNITNGCSGIITAVPRLNFPGMCFSDASNGLRNTDFVSSWPSGIHVGASWNRELAAQRAYGIGAEFKKKGVNVLLGPVVSPAGRMVRSGRIWEGMSADPYLAGALVYETVTSSQKAGVITSTKHFIGNEQETHRIPTGGIASVSSNIDDRTMHELYLWPFQDAVHAGTGNIMCSYNRVNNSYACANSKILNGLLKTELGFQGFVVSDWLAQHAGTATVLSGLDMAMPNAGDFWGDRLFEAVQNGSVPEDRITDMATRIMASWYQMGQNVDFPTPGIGMPIDLTQPHLIVDGRNASDEATLRNGAIEGHVLLKNTNHSLPLIAPKLLSVFGYSAKAPDTMNYSPGTLTAWTVGSESANYTDILDGFFYTQPQDATPIARYGTIFSGGGSGTNSQTLVSAPFDALQQQAWLDRTQLFWDFTSNNVSVHAASDACLVMINAWASESYDRSSLSDDYSDTLVTNVADQCSNTIVIVHNAGVRLVDAWIEHPNVTALIFAHLPGQYSGHALVDLLYGHVNPSGKLPYTVAKHQSDYGSLLAPTQPEGEYALFPQSNFNEGVLVDYRRFDALKITPRYEFGFGLSYTTFSYHNLHIQLAANITAGYPTGIVLQGGQADLWDNLVTVTANVTNTGRVSGAEVAQLYMSLPHIGSSACNSSVVPIPIRQLRGFDKQVIDVGTTAVVSFSLTRRDLSIWDATAQKWLLQRGTYTVSVGSSSRMLPLQGTFHVSDRE